MSNAVQFRYLSQADVIACGGLDMHATIAAVENALQLADAGSCIEPDGAMVHWGAPHRERMIVHSAFVGGDVGALGLKWVGSNPDNPLQRGLPRATGLIALIDHTTGAPRALMDGTVISAMRTGAVVGAAARLLAPPHATDVAIIGAGVIGRTQLMGLAAALPQLRCARVYDQNRARAQAYAADMSEELKLELMVVESAEAAVRGAHIVAPATNVGTADRYIRADWIASGALLLNASLNDYLFEAVLRCAHIVVDTRRQLEVRGLLLADMVEAGLLDRERIVELGTLLRHGSAPPPHDATTFFSPNGMGIEDVINADRIYREAVRVDAGTVLPLWDRPHWF